MDIEQLTLILEAAAAAGDGAMQVVFVWFAFKFFTFAAGISVVAGAIFGAYKVAMHGIGSNTLAGKIEMITGRSMSSYGSHRAEFLIWVNKNWESHD